MRLVAKGGLLTGVGAAGMLADVERSGKANL
jgi:hypothetical protein